MTGAGCPLPRGILAEAVSAPSFTVFHQFVCHRTVRPVRERICDDRGLMGRTVSQTLAGRRLGKARVACQHVFNAWEEADSDIPIFKRAKARCAKPTPMSTGERKKNENNNHGDRFGIDRNNLDNLKLYT
jgi:hypothetical protein